LMQREFPCGLGAEAPLSTHTRPMLVRSITRSRLKTSGARLMKTKGRRRAIVAAALRSPSFATACGSMPRTPG
jgi:hypothetical protein